VSDRAFIGTLDVALLEVSELSSAMQARIRSLHVSVLEEAFKERLEALLTAPRPSTYRSQGKPVGSPFRMGP
jgi:hypothetical protein